MRIVMAAAAALAVTAPPAAAQHQRLGGKGTRDVVIATAGSTVAAAWRDGDGHVLVAVGTRGRRPGRPVRVPRVRRATGVRLAVNRRGDAALAWIVNDRSIEPDPEDRFGEYCCRRVWAATMRAGGRFGPRRRLSRARNDARLWRVAVDARGRGTVAFSDARGLRVASGARGRRFGEPRTLLRLSRGNVQVVALRSDRIAYGVTPPWSDETQPDVADLFTRPLRAGRPGAATLSAHLENPAGLYQAGLALSPGGRPALIWQRRTDPISDPSVHVMAAVGEAGGALGEAREIARYRGYSGGFSPGVVTVTDRGDALFAVGQSASPGSVVHVARASRGEVGGTQHLPASGYQPEPRVALDPRGRAAVAWREGDDTRLRVSFAGPGRRFGRPRAFGKMRGYYEPAVAFSAGGVAWLGWADTRGARLRREVRP